MSKKIFIHVGPPKTGTSAVQKWFSDNTKLLSKEGVYYPSHDVDQNGVSSGNVSLLYDVNNEKQIELNQERLEKLLTEFENSEFQTLFLSSEFFFRAMLELKSHIPQAKFIAYVRNPMEIKESSYNQSVKRHFQKQILNAGRSKRLPFMDRFVNFKNQYGTDDLVLRLYGAKYFKYGNIVSDILHIFGIEFNVDLPLVNSSYQFEALEFKRWLNQFELEKHQVVVDRALQAYKSGTASYSLISTEQYIDDNLHYSKVIEGYALELETDNLAPLVSDMKNVKTKNYLVQKLDEKSFRSVCDFLQSTLKVDYYLLIQDVKNSEPKQGDEYYQIFINSCEDKYKFIHLHMLIQSKVKRLINSLKRRIKFSVKFFYGNK
ncbi:hypothetical protein [Paraglaciecola sp. 25GB23A]|uniref:hypothetical protein n=1 Tax=Paraglaciecola sp. 25GB23A TaxID=3156068 RepID=UPI0032AEDF6A